MSPTAIVGRGRAITDVAKMEVGVVYAEQRGEEPLSLAEGVYAMVGVGNRDESSTICPLLKFDYFANMSWELECAGAISW